MSLSHAQKVTLAVGVPLSVALMGWGALNAVAAVGRGTEQVSEQIPVTGGRLVAGLGSGDVTLRAGSGSGPAGLTGTVRYSLVRPEVTLNRDASRTSIGFGCAVPVGWCSLDATLSIPADVTAADVSTGSGNITVDTSATPGTLTLSTGMGDITATGLSAADITARSGVGNITIVLTKPPTSLDVTDSLGDVRIVLPAGYSYKVLDIHSALGSTSTPGLQRSADSRYAIVATSDLGDVTVTEAG